MKFTQVKFDQDIIELVLDNHAGDKTLYLFPTVQSRNLAIKIFQNNWNFSASDFFTLEDWKYSLFHPSLPLLKEEKRSLAWFLSLDEASKTAFTITDYFSSIELGNKFFSFWEEINEELVEEDNILEILEQKSTAGDWQISTFQQLQNIKDNYHDFIVSKKFTDKVFAYQQAELVLEFDYQEVIVLNQYYLTNLEKFLLQQLDNVTIYNQFPAEIFDKENLSITSEITAANLLQVRTEKITEIRTAEDFSMISALYNQISLKRPNAIIDFRFDQQPYSNFFSQEHFAVNTAIIFSQTSLYRFFYLLKNIISNLFYHDKKLLLPLQNAIEAFSSSELIKYFFVDYQQKQSAILSTLYQLAEHDFQYIDLNLTCLKEQKVPKENHQSLTKILDFVNQVYQLKSMENFNHFISDFSPSKILTEQEKTYTNILEQFAQVKNDFAILEELSLVENWNEIFLKKNFAAASLKLFLDYMQPKKIKQQLTPAKRNSITALQDTRNMLYDTIYILNITEGVLPPKRKVPFLLSENQRKLLGLKTFEDIRNREKYYFYRLVAQSKEVVLFSIENLEENREVSSFAEELRLQFPDIYTLQDKVKYSYHKLYQQYLGNTSANQIPQIAEDFHRLAFGKTDFPNNEIKLSFYKWDELQRNPFGYYLKHHAKLAERPKDLTPQYSGKLIGNITHEIFNLIWQRIIDLYQGNKIHHNFYYTNQNYADDAFKHLFAHDKELVFKLPHNYSQRYFDNIFLPILKSGIMGFFRFLDADLRLSDKHITILPETEKTDSVPFKKVRDYQLYLRGKADMRIETDTTKFIFDFKTGSDNNDKKKKFQDQLIMYEELYYLSSKKELQEAVKSYLYFVEKQSHSDINIPKKLDKSDVISDFEKRIENTVTRVLEQGFELGEKAGKYEILEISRRDLLPKAEEK